MEGGEGRDTYVIDAGDTVRDSDGVGELHWGGQALTGGARAADDPTNTYCSEDGRFTYALENNTLSVTDTLARDQIGREPAVIENFQNGQLGITLSEAGGVARPPAAPPRAEEQQGVGASAEDRGTVDAVPRIPAPAMETGDSQSRREPARGPFDDPYANSVYAALLAGDSHELDRIAGAFSRSPEGQRMAELGEQMPIQQQHEAQTPLQDQQVQAREGPAMRM